MRVDPAPWVAFRSGYNRAVRYPLRHPSPPNTSLASLIAAIRAHAAYVVQQLTQPAKHIMRPTSCQPVPSVSVPSVCADKCVLTVRCSIQTSAYAADVTDNTSVLTVFAPSNAAFNAVDVQELLMDATQAQVDEVRPWSARQRTTATSSSTCVCVRAKSQAALLHAYRTFLHHIDLLLCEILPVTVNTSCPESAVTCTCAPAHFSSTLSERQTVAAPPQPPSRAGC